MMGSTNKHRSKSLKVKIPFLTGILILAILAFVVITANEDSRYPYS